MNKIIKYSRNVKSQASIKTPNQCGLSLTKNIDRIVVEAINPVTNTATTWLYMQIPLENIDEVVEALKSLK